MCETGKLMVGDGLGGATVAEKSVGSAEVGVTGGEIPEGQVTGWNYAQALKAIAVAEARGDIILNGIRKIIVMVTVQGEDASVKAVMEELYQVLHISNATGPGGFTQRLPVTLSMFLDDNDYRQAGTGIDKEDSDQIVETQKLLEMLT